MRAFIIALIALLSISSTFAARYPLASTFRNPIKLNGPDPSILKVGDTYYLTVTRQTEIRLWSSKDPTVFDDASSFVAWTKPDTGDLSTEIWAPEIHYFGCKFYIYFTAANKDVPNSHKIYALRLDGTDPMQGPWTLVGKIQTDPEDHWAIDATAFEVNGQLYISWCGQETGPDQTQVFIAKLSDPVTISGPRVLISRPEAPWEKITADGGQGGGVNEAPQFWAHDSKAFLTFSASDCGSDEYAIGILTADLNADFTNPASWTKNPNPVFIENPAGSVYATGHNGFFKSPDGSEDWIVYHANPGPGLGCDTARESHAQKFTYNSDGTPNFGVPIPLNQDIPKPSPL